MICPSCGLDNKPDANYCDDCGAELAAGAAVAAGGRRAPLAVGSELKEAPAGPSTLRIEQAEARGRLNVYRAVRIGTGEAVRLLEDAEPEASLTIPADAADGSPLAEDASVAARAWRALSGVETPHLWRVERFIYDEGRGFVVGAPLPEETLHDHLAAARPLQPEEAQALGLSLLEAVQALHDRGYLHLAIHPSAIHIDEEGLPILAGYDRLASRDALPQVFSVLDGYSAPEAYGVGGPACPASDVYSVGATLYYSLCRRVPAEVSREQFFYFAPLSRETPDIPTDLERIVMKAVGKNLPGRYESATAMSEELAAASVERRRAAQPAPQPVAVGVGAGAADPAPRASSGGSQWEGAVPPPAPISATPDEPPAASLSSGFLPFQVGLRSDIGRVRSVNQDSMLVMTFSAVERSIPTSALLVIVADGMGGEAEGDKASSLAIRTMATYVLQNNIPIVTGADTVKLHPRNPVERLEELLREAMEHANATIFGYAQKDASRRGMGSTLTSLMIEWPYAVFGHAGDTRAYLLRDGLDQVTEDHSLVGKLVRLGQLTREEARNSPQRSYLYRAMGTAGELEIDVYSRRLEPGDRLLLCSDGVWEYFMDDEIVDFMTRFDDPQQACEALVEEVLRRGADDNCTAVILYVPLKNVQQVGHS